MGNCYPDKIINIALTEVGYKEKASNKDLYDKDKNAGHSNYNKYANDIDTYYPNFYNGKKNGFDWCAVFVDWLFIKAYGYDDALRLTCQPEHSLGASCTFSYKYYATKKQSGSTPKLGAQIFFGDKSTKTCTHTGLVVDYDNEYVTTVEGNASDGVYKKKYPLSDSKIYGYGYPYYSKADNVFTVDVESTKYNKIVINLK